MVGSEVTALRTAIDEVAAVDPSRLTSGERAELVIQLEIVRTLLTSIAAGVLRAFDMNGDWAFDGAYSAANWIAARTGTARADVGRRVRLANRLSVMLATAAALARAEITETHVMVLCRCLGPRTREAFERDESFLVETAKTLTADELALFIAEWIDRVDQDGAEPHPEKPSSLSASQLPDGRVVGRFDLEAHLGVPFLEQLRAKTEEVFARAKDLEDVDPTDPLACSSIQTLRAHALAELVERGGARSDRHRRQPTMCVVLRDEAANDPADAMAAIRRTVFGTVVPRSVLDVWSCDGEFERLVLDAEGVPLELGRAVRWATPAQRKALAVRDGGCAFPGCDMPPSWCDAHHVRYWTNGGTTDIDVMCLLCRHHHGRVHGGHVRVEMIEGRPAFTLTDGRVVERPRRRAAA